MNKAGDNSHSALHCFAVLAVIISLLATSADGKAGGQNINTLPWEIIAEKFDAKNPFCTAKRKDEKTNDFALGPDALIMTLPCNIQIPQEQTKAELGLSIWQRDQWVDLAPLAVHINPNGLRVGINAIAERFYNLSVVFDKNDIGKENLFHAIVATDWKKDLLGWCRKNKEQIETNPDSQLIYSSIAVSHFDHLMELISKSQTLSEHILAALQEAIKANTAFENSNCPDFVIGLNKIRLKRFKGASIAEFVIFVPTDYESSKKWPLYLHPDPMRRYSPNYPNRSGFIDVWWHFPMPKEFEWKDYEQFFCILRDKLSLNEDRVYLDGQCGNGISAMALALKYPDQWAECAIRLGNSYRHLAGNAWNLPLIFVRWDNNEEHLVSYYDFAVKSFLCRNPKDFKFCVSGQTVVTVRGKPIPDNLRIKNPSRVLYTIESLANPSAYWVQIDGREDENFIASINAIVCGQRILVKTDNVDAYTLNLELAPLDCLKPVEIIENNQRLDSVTGPVFVRKSPNHETFAYVKNKSLHGPICDVFTDAYTVLYTDGKDSNETEGIKAIAKQISGGGPCLPEDELSDEIIQNHNLIIVGRTGKCQFLSKISESLPLQISKSEIVFENQRVDGDVGLMMVYPNPKNSKKYIALILGGSSRVINNIPVIWENDLKNAQADIAIFKVGSDNKHKFIRLEKFSTIWSWHEQWSQPLTTVSKQHPKWRWRQWVGHVVRKQLDADIAICEDIFKGVEKPDQEKITLRDLDRIFKNKWFVKIKLNGKELKMLLTRNVAVKDISGSTAIRPVIDGISLIKGMGGSGYMHVSQIKEDQYYMVALPEKLVNGSRIGMILTDYEIVGDGYQIQLLQDYLKSRNNLELDSELKKMKLTIM